MSTFKYNNSITYNCWVHAPDGFKFNLEAIKNSNIFDDDTNERLTCDFSGRVLKWKEYQFCTSDLMTREDWAALITTENGCIEEI